MPTQSGIEKALQPIIYLKTGYKIWIIGLYGNPKDSQRDIQIEVFLSLPQ